MKLSKNRRVILCSPIKRNDVEQYYKTKQISLVWINDKDLFVVEKAIDQYLQNFKNDLMEESCITLLLYEETCRLAFSLQQKTQAQLILVNPPVHDVFGKDTPVIESDDEYQILLTIKHLTETGA